MSIIKVPKDKTKIKITDLLKSHTQGLTIKTIMGKTSLARHTILARLHNLIEQGKVTVRQVNMAKLHYWRVHVPTATNAYLITSNKDLMNKVKR